MDIAGYNTWFQYNQVLYYIVIEGTNFVFNLREISAMPVRPDHCLVGVLDAAGLDHGVGWNVQGAAKPENLQKQKPFTGLGAGTSSMLVSVNTPFHLKFQKHSLNEERWLTSALFLSLLSSLSHCSEIILNNTNY